MTVINADKQPNDRLIEQARAAYQAAGHTTPFEQLGALMQAVWIAYVQRDGLPPR